VDLVVELDGELVAVLGPAPAQVLVVAQHVDGAAGVAGAVDAAVLAVAPGEAGLDHPAVGRGGLPVGAQPEKADVARIGAAPEARVALAAEDDPPVEVAAGPAHPHVAVADVGLAHAGVEVVAHRLGRVARDDVDGPEKGVGAVGGGVGEPVERDGTIGGVVRDDEEARHEPEQVHDLPRAGEADELAVDDGHRRRRVEDGLGQARGRQDHRHVGQEVELGRQGRVPFGRGGARRGGEGAREGQGHRQKAVVRDHRA